MRRNRETAFPPPELMPEGLTIHVQSRQPGRSIPCRLMYPSARKTAEQRKQCKGTFLHFHGGGWVLGDHLSADELMLKYADAADSAVISVGYRLAPEHPFPKGPEDCFDTAEYLIRNSLDEYGGPLRFLGGEVSYYCFLYVPYFFRSSYDELLKLRDFYDSVQPPLITPILTTSDLLFLITSHEF